MIDAAGADVLIMFNSAIRVGLDVLLTGHLNMPELACIWIERLITYCCCTNGLRASIER